MDPDRLELHRRARDFLKLDRYASILAHIMHFGQNRLLELLPRFGLSPEQWQVADEAWTHELAEGRRRQQHEQAARFNLLFAKTRQELAEKQPPMTKVGG